MTIAKLSKVAGVSSSALARRFKSEVGQPPYKFIKSRRLDEAHRLLSHGNLNIGEVAGLIGYESHSAFSEAFKRKFGTSPSHRGKAKK
jgi:AraC-like DNA-binding protein